MATLRRLNLSLSEDELILLREVAPSRKLGRFIKDAALARARQIQRDRLRAEIVSAYEADPEFLTIAGQEWDVVAHDVWPKCQGCLN